MNVFLKSFFGKTKLLWGTFLSWVQGKVPTEIMVKVAELKVTPVKNSELVLVSIKLSEAQIRETLRGKRDFIVQITAEGQLTATCKKCHESMSLGAKDEYLWFYCYRCRRVSFEPVANIDRNIGFAIKDGRTLQYEMFFASEIPPTLKSPFQTIYPKTAKDLSELVQIHAGKVNFKEYNFEVVFPATDWQLEPEMYGKGPRKEVFTFTRQTRWIDASGNSYSPTMAIAFFPIPNGTLLNQLPRMAKYLNLPDLLIDSTFGDAGSDLDLDGSALGQYGHMDSESFKGQAYSVYFLFLAKDTTGVVISLEIIDLVLDQAKPEFYEIMRSAKFIA